MCGIIGYVGPRECRDLLLAGLGRLEYRGYDSAGLSLVTNGSVGSVHAVGNLQQLRDAVASSNGDLLGSTGVGHTRWATHGRVTRENAHPHSDSSGRFQIVLNGIVENWAELRDRMKAEGAEFSSETDAEVVAHLIAHHFEGDLVEAVRRSYNELRGHYAFVAMSADAPGVLVGARKECPLVVGLGEGESFIASAIPAFLDETRRVQLVHDGEIVAVTPEGSRFLAPDGSAISREVDEVEWDIEQAEKGGYETFMLKEIHEQADAVAETVAGRLGDGVVDLAEVAISDDFLRDVRRVVIVACGTSYHAGLVGRYAIETWARRPVEMDIASEFRYRDPVLSERDLVIGISQSGETADTLAAMRLARERGAKVLAITNIRGSQATRDADGVLFTRAGLEIGVAATKTFVAQVAAMYLFALKLAEVHGTLEPEVMHRLCHELREIPHQITRLVEEVDAPVRGIAEHWRDASFFLYLGRHVGLPICLEGALKLKEISYIPTDAYAAGEMKHGPIALLDERTPVVCVATESPVLDKVLSNIAEVRARGAHVVAVTTQGNYQVAEYAEELLEVPRTDWMLQPLLAVIPLQLLAYHIARTRGLNVDQPRNLAKTVTVE
ncbi:MAG TPA: glutamine--fructose-6-phosphate transaminase (isomerizing) [Thermoleophilaceae bacterium]|jgi:glucosamine--fructose-6-phosphate aminotransferase (isomerizing)|nr:glutamine--fructose-6-phosphate transaminase (isomerizing) [Thermoleophilaceae bacterium]